MSPARLSLVLFVPLAACGDDGAGDGAVADDLPVETFVNPPELAPDGDGVRHLAFGPNAVELDGRRFCLRSYNGMVPAPTIRVKAGTDRRVRIDLDNAFGASQWRYIAGKEGTTDAHCNDFNLTNLHFHGGHVRPDYAAFDAADPCTGNGCAPDQRYYGDNVLMHVAAGERLRYRWDLDEAQPHHEGTDWYHPHIHGTTAIQVSSGAAGAFVIEGALDALPEIARARERLMVLNQIPIDSEHTKALEAGEACSERNLSVNNFLAVTEYMPTLINGKRVPRLVTPPGQVERWRFVHAGNPDELGLKLHVGRDADCREWELAPVATAFTQIARDGITLPELFVTDTLWMSPGYRIDALLKMPPADTTLCLVERRVRDLEGTAIAVINVDARAGTPTETEFPAPAAITALAKPTTFRAHLGGSDAAETEVSCASTTGRAYDQRVVLLVPETDSLDDDPIDQDLFAFDCDPSTSAHTPTGGEDPSPLPGDQSICQCPSPNINCRNFDDRRRRGYRSDRVMTVGTAEQWEVAAFDGHPFHIHINPFLVCPTNSNKEPPFAHWRDTFWVQAEDGPRKLLTNFEDFTGRFVLHCHKLNHEDEGMMEVIEICADGDDDCLCLDHDESGACLPMSGCYDDDKQCRFAAIAAESYPAPPPPTPDLCGGPDLPFP